MKRKMERTKCIHGFNGVCTGQLRVGFPYCNPCSNHTKKLNKERKARTAYTFKKGVVSESDSSMLLQLETELRKTKTGVQIDNKSEVYLPFKLPSALTDCRTENHLNELTADTKDFLLRLLQNINVKEILKEFNEKRRFNLCAPSALYSIGNVNQQFGHQDLHKECYQVAINATKQNVPSTLIYGGRRVTPEEASISLGLNGIVTKSLDEYSGLCISKGELDAGLKSVEPSGWDPLDMTVIRGGIPHAGPSSNDFRCVIFFALVPTTFGIYDSNHQVRSWDVPSLVYKELLDFGDSDHARDEYKRKCAIQCLRYAIEYMDYPFFKRLYKAKDVNSLLNAFLEELG